METVPIAQELRQLVIKMLSHAGSGHTAGSLGMADIFSVLYFSDLLHLPRQSDSDGGSDPSRDRIILSNGHICPIWYAALAKKGYFPMEELFTLRQFGSRLQGHPHRNFTPDVEGSYTSGVVEPHNLPGIENTSGPLGQGIGFAVGLALGLKQQQNPAKVICLTGDGELNEGQCWEAFMAAAKYKLSNLTFIIDRNDIQIDGFTHDVMPLEPLKDKLIAFGLTVIEINGHNHSDIYNAINKLSNCLTGQPAAIIAHTIPGKGVSFMEGKFEWHGKVPDQQETELAMKELW